MCSKRSIGAKAKCGASCLCPSTKSPHGISFIDSSSTICTLSCASSDEDALPCSVTSKSLLSADAFTTSSMCSNRSTGAKEKWGASSHSPPAMFTCSEIRSRSKDSSQQHPAVDVVEQDLCYVNKHVVSGLPKSNAVTSLGRLPGFSFSFILNYMLILAFVCVSYVAYFVTKSAEKALTQATEDFVGNTSAGLAQGFGQRLATFLFRTFVLWRGEPTTSLEEVLPGVLLAW